MTIEFSVGQKALQSLIEEFSPLGELSNEAQTRFSFIDRFLVDVLGWPRMSVAVEVYEDGERSDYECGKPRQLIVEAKRADKSFSIPPRGKKASTKIKLRSLLEFNEATKSGIEQVQKYCSDRGVPAAALCNGPQLIVFLATRLDGKSVMDGDALVFDSYESLLTSFATIYECLSPAGIEEKRLIALLGGQDVGVLPPKLSASCLNYFAYKYSSAFQENVKNASSIVIEDIGRTSEFEYDFLKECYCESGPLTQYSLLSKNILSTRYSALFSSTEHGSVVEEVNPKKQGDKLGEKVLAEALARRPVVLLGDVGVGKTSFIKNLIQIGAASQFEKAIFIYFDLGSQGALSSNVRDALLTQIENTLRADHKINLQDLNLLQKIYKSELDDFDSGYFSLLKSSNMPLFLEKRVEHIKSLVQDRAEHLRKVLSQLSRDKRCQIVIVIDNSDQRDISVQQDAFVIAHELASTWDALVFLSLRPQTFHASKRSGTVSAYPPKIFVISPPKLEDVIEKRLAFALKIAQGKLPLKARDLSMHVESLAILIKALQTSLRDNPELYEFIINVSSGNVRVAIELISKFLGNPNVNSEQIVKIFSENGEYRIPLHEFSKGGLLGDYAYYQEDASYAYNVFSTAYANKREHFASLVLMGYLSWEGAQRKQPDGFVGLEALQNELQSFGFRVDQIQTHLQKLTRKKLVETTERRLLETDTDVDGRGMPEAFRLTMLGAYHLKKWAYDFSFLESMSFDTPIFDDATRGTLTEHVNEQSLFARHQRATAFREYLDNVWEDLEPRAYFNWREIRKTGNPSFERVRKRLSDQGKL
jgi:GTPase SAR1 family protein